MQNKTKIRGIALKVCLKRWQDNERQV